MKLFIRNLKEGISEFHEENRALDFNLPDHEIYPNTIALDLIVDRLDNIYRIKLRLNTRARYTCDRCLDEFDATFDETGEQIFQLGAGKLDADDEVEFLPEDTIEIDISPVIREIFLVGRPMKLLCRDNCKGLCAHCGINLNDGNCSCTTDKIDPRLAKLKTLLK